MTTYFISDLHLDDAQPGATARFLDFMAHRAPEASALYILGDLFEYWVGDDFSSALSQQVCERLRALSDAGTKLYFMAGNRDFLLGPQWCAKAGLRQLDDPTVIELNGGRVLLCHGDTLCTDDVPYQQFRQQVRDPRWQQQFLAQDLQQRLAFADSARSQSQEITAAKAEAIMDVNADAVTKAFAEHNAPTLIHGHTHRPTDEAWPQAGPTARRLVLGAWHDHAEIAVADSKGLRLVALNP